MGAEQAQAQSLHPDPSDRFAEADRPFDTWVTSFEEAHVRILFVSQADANTTLCNFAVRAKCLIIAITFRARLALHCRPARLWLCRPGLAAGREMQIFSIHTLGLPRVHGTTPLWELLICFGYRNSSIDFARRGAYQGCLTRLFGGRVNS